MRRKRQAPDGIVTAPATLRSGQILFLSVVLLSSKEKSPPNWRWFFFKMVDLIGIEPTTLRMRTVRSPSWAIGPLWWVLWKVEYTGKTPSQSYLLYYNRLFQKVKGFCHKIFDAGTVIQFCTSQTAQRWDKTGYRNMAGLLDSLNIPLLEERCTTGKGR